MTDELSPGYRRKLRELYATLDRLSEDVTGIDAWAVERVTKAVEASLREERDAEADRLVAAMERAVEEVESES